MEMMRTIELPSSKLLGHRWTALWRVGFPPGSSRAQADAVAREEFGTDRRGAKRSRRAAAGSSLAARSYPQANDLTAAVKEACPKGVDVFFDNTGGPIHDAVMRNLSIGARVIICGRIALAAQFGKPDIGERFMGQLIVSRASVHGFLVLDWWHRRDEALRRLAEWQLAGKIRFKEDVLEGIERMPEAFLRLLHGKNFGKQIVRIN